MIQKLAWVFGLVFIIIGILGFIPSLVPSGFLFGTFSVDVMHNVVHLVSGVLAIFAAWKSETYARLYFKVFGIVYAIVTVVGLIEGTTVFGLMTVNGWDNALDFVIAIVALWAGFGAGTEPSARTGAAM